MPRIPRLLTQSPVITTAIGLAAVVLLGLADYSTGPDISFTLFYLIPLSLVAWSSGRRAGFLLCLISAIVWLRVDLVMDPDGKTVFDGLMLDDPAAGLFWPTKYVKGDDVLALARRVPRMVRQQDRGEWPKERWRTFLGHEMRGQTLGIVGYGSIGRETARIAKQGFGMRVLALTRSGHKADRGYHEPAVGDPEGKIPDAWFTRDQLGDLLAQSDFVLISIPLTDETRRMIGEAELRSMKPTAFIVNIARGEILDETALERALKENWIAGAGLDVFAKEPLPTDSELWKLENVLMAPHISSATPHYDDRAVALFSENLRRYLRGDELLNLVNKAKGY